MLQRTTEKGRKYDDDVADEKSWSRVMEDNPQRERERERERERAAH